MKGAVTALAKGSMMHRFLAAAALSLALAAPALAQSGLEGRVGKLEGEMRAVQRKVFPGGSGAVVEPQITPAAPATGPVGAPATTPVEDLTQRVSALEAQVQAITGQMEQAQHRLRQLEEQFAAFRASAAARPAPAADVTVPTAPRPAAAPVATPAAAAPAASDKPDTGDAAEDGYTYGYRLWTAKKYGEAATQLKKVVADHPKHRRASYAQNLLGRAYLDDGKPSLAAIAFYDSYKKFPEGERAPDSLFYLGSALMKLNKAAEACTVYGELTDVYGAKISAARKGEIERARAAAKCK